MKSKYADADNSDGDLNEIEGMSKFKDDALTQSQMNRSDKFCAKFCWMIWFTLPSVIQYMMIYGQELGNYYVVGRTGDFGYIDV